MDSVELTYRTPAGERIEIANGYIYEITKYFISRKEHRVEILDSVYVSSKKLLKSKSKISNKKGDTCEYISISLIGAPIEYITKNNLPNYQLLKKIKTCQRKKK